MNRKFNLTNLEIPWQLNDGRQVLLRPLMPSDRKRLKRGFKLMSSESLYFRFLTPMSKLSSIYLKYLTNIDQEDHVAWGAIDPAEPDFPGFGVGRFIRLPDSPETAEVALTIIDACQKKGLGTLLLGVLYLMAERNHVQKLQATVQAENKGVLKLMSNFNVSASFSEGMMQLNLPVSAGRKQLPYTKFGLQFRELLANLESKILR